MKKDSDSESAEEIDMKAAIYENEAKVKVLEQRLKGINSEWKIKVMEKESNMERLQSNYQFSINANASLKADYDLLQEKLDKTMKTSNTIIQDRKEQADTLSQKVSTLQAYYDDAEVNKANDAAKNEKAMATVKEQAQKELTEMSEKYK